MIHNDNWDDPTEAPELQAPAAPSPQYRRDIPAEADDVMRALPHALGPEKSLLSSMLQDPQEFIGVAAEEKLTPAHFYLPSHATLYGVLVELFESGQEIELVSMIQKLIDRGLLDRIGGPATLTDLYTYSPSPGYFRHHLQHVKDKFVLRSIIQRSNEAIAQAYDQPDEVAELLDQTEAAILAIRETQETRITTSLKATVDECLDDIRRIIEGDKEANGISTGFEVLDHLGCYLKPAEMFVIAARPSMGKTSLMMNIVEHLAIGESRRGMVFSVEMRKKQLVQNLINSRAKFNLAAVTRGQVANKGDLQRIQRASIEIASAHANLIIDDRSELSIGQLRAAARREHRKAPLQWIAIDYLQLMKSGSRQSRDNREREVAEISAGIKSVCKELGIPAIVLAQLNRGPEGRTGKNLGKPRMSDLRESGALEQDADMIGLLYREAYYAADEEAKEAAQGVAQLDLAKNRNGATGTAPLTFIAELMRFESGHPAKEQPDMFAPKTAKNRLDD
jgi:replicative DNA helicase